MSDDNRPPDLVQYGRPLRKRSRGPAPQSSAAGAPAVGPVEHPLPPDGAATIVRAPRPPAGLGGEEHRPERAPQRHRRERREPDDGDRQLQELVSFMARGLVD